MKYPPGTQNDWQFLVQSCMGTPTCTHTETGTRSLPQNCLESLLSVSLYCVMWTISSFGKKNKWDTIVRKNLQSLTIYSSICFSLLFCSSTFTQFRSYENTENFMMRMCMMPKKEVNWFWWIQCKQQLRFIWCRLRSR